MDDKREWGIPEIPGSQVSTYSKLWTLDVLAGVDLCMVYSKSTYYRI